MRASYLARLASAAAFCGIAGPIEARDQSPDRHAVRIAHQHLSAAPHGKIDPCAIEREGAVLFLTDAEIAGLSVPFQRLGSLRDHALRFRPVRTMAEVGVPSLSALLGEPVRPREGARIASAVTQLSYDRYHDPDEGIAFFQNLAAAFPHIARLQSIGTSVQGRDLWMLKLTDNPDSNEPGEYATFFCALHHAREWATHESILYLAEYLTNHYDDDYLVQHILDHSVVWVLLAVNPDGFQISWDSDRYQRTNANGVDLNRNYDFRWAYDDNGSSPSIGSETYRGPLPASEPETQAIQTFLRAERPVIAVTNHTYSQLVLYPWGFTGLITPEAYTSLRAVADGFAERIRRTSGLRYLPGPSNYTIYPVNGDFTDYAYGALGILAYTPEQRPHSFEFGGFELPEDQLLANARENLEASLWVMNLVAQARSVPVPAGLFSPGLNRFSLPLTPINQQPELALSMSPLETSYLSAYLDDAEIHYPPFVGAYPADFEGVGVGSAYRFHHNVATAAWADAYASYTGLPHVFDEGSVVMLQNVQPGVNEIGIPGEHSVRLRDVSIYRRYIVPTSNTFGTEEWAFEERSAIEDSTNRRGPWIDWNWTYLRPDGTTEVSHPTGENNADLFVHPHRAYIFDVFRPSYVFYGWSVEYSVYLLRFPPPLLGDGDENGAIDAVDYGGFYRCWTGPLRAPVSMACTPFDVDHDFDVDLQDLQIFQRHYGRVR